MGREPREFKIWGRILRIGQDRFSVVVSATSIDFEAEGPGAAFSESAEARSAADAKQMQWQMIRELTARLRTAGNIVVQVETD